MFAGAASVFRWLTGAVEGVRIALDYPKFERECRQDWEKDARARFSTSHLEAEVSRLMKEPRSSAFLLYEKPIASQRSQAEGLRAVIDDAKSKLAVLTRDYQSELDAAHAALNSLNEDLRDCRENLKRAYSELEEAKSDLDAWYSRAEGNWIGNGGTQLPGRAIFGQSLGDRDSLKSQRDSAAGNVGRYKSGRSAIQNQIDRARTQVLNIKVQRQAMYNLRAQGFDRRLVEGTLSTASAALEQVEGSIGSATSSMHEYLAEAKRRLGVVDLELQIHTLKRVEEDRIAAFESVSERASRKAVHRRMWLVSHGRG